MTFIDESKPLRNMLLEDDTDDLEFHPPQTNRDGAGSWQRKQRNFAFNQALAPDPKIDRMRDVWDKGNLFEEGGDAWFKTRAAVGLDDVNGEFDVAKTETLLDQAGVYNLKDVKGPTGIFSYFQQDAIKQYQADKGLRVDGRMAPNGETMRALKTQLTPKLNALAAAAKAAKAAEAKKTEKAAPVQIADNAGQTPVMNDAHPKGLLENRQTNPNADATKKKPVHTTLARHEAMPRLFGNSKVPTKKDLEDPLKYSVDQVAKTFRGYAAAFKKDGHRHAHEFLQHFMDGSGTKKNFTLEQARGFKPIRDGEARIQENFETVTFLGKTKDKELNKKLKGIKEGSPVEITDDFDAEVGIRLSLLNMIDSGTGFYKAFGLTEIKSEATFKANRVGNIVYIEGTIEHHWKDRYDFKKWQLAAEGALTLQKHRGAKPFDFGANWRQKFSGTVDISNKVLSNPKIKWRDVEMQKSK